MLLAKLRGFQHFRNAPKRTADIRDLRVLHVLSMKPILVKFNIALHLPRENWELSMQLKELNFDAWALRFGAATMFKHC